MFYVRLGELKSAQNELVLLRDPVKLPLSEVTI